MLQVVGFAAYELSRETFGNYTLVLVLFFTRWMQVTGPYGAATEICVLTMKLLPITATKYGN